MTVKYQRILLKLSGEALSGSVGFGIDPNFIELLAAELKLVIDKGVQIGLVIGGGNLFRGRALSEVGLERTTGDYMGMLATVMNALAMKDALNRQKVITTVSSAWPIGPVCATLSTAQACQELAQNHVVIFSAGTGNPYFTTDTAASLRAVEIKADLLIKATKVDGVYSADPVRYPEAVRYDKLTFQQAIDAQLQVMDQTAMIMCRENNLSLRVYDMSQKNGLLDMMQGENIGTLLENER